MIDSKVRHAQHTEIVAQRLLQVRRSSTPSPANVVAGTSTNALPFSSYKPTANPRSARPQFPQTVSREPANDQPRPTHREVSTRSGAVQTVLWLAVGAWTPRIVAASVA